MKRAIIIIILLFSGYLYGQQIPLFSQYMFNDIVINPAIAGTKNYFTTKFVHRNQWVGIPGAPVTQTLSIHGPIKHLSMGVGGFIYNDITGPGRQTGIKLTYAYHINLPKGKLSLGIHGGMFQYKYSKSELTTHQQNDNAVLNASGESMWIPDASFGAYYFNDIYYIGISTSQLFETKLKYGEFQRVTLGHLERHYSLLAGYNIPFYYTKQFELEPSVLIKYVDTAPLEIDLNIKGFYMNSYWLGASYRSGDAIVLLAGLKIKDNIHLGYSYDITTSELHRYSRGSHEIMLGYNLIKVTRKK